MKIKYRRATIEIKNFIKPNKCECCGKELGKECKKLDFHHWKYAYNTEEVRRNHLLALNNTTILCFRCHQIANALKKVIETEEKTLNKLFNLIDKHGDIERYKKEGVNIIMVKK